MGEVLMGVLLLGKNTIAPSPLLLRLEQRRCRYSFAKTAEEGMVLFQQHKVDLILSMSSVREALYMTSVIEPSNCSIFCAFQVERG